MVGTQGTRRGGELPETLAAEAYLGLAVALANAPATDPRLVDLALSLRRNRATKTLYVTPAGQARYLREGRQLQQDLRRWFDRFDSSPTAARRDLRASLGVMLEAVDVVTTLELRSDGTLEHRHQYFPNSTEAVVGLALAFLLDPNRPHGGKFGRCKLDSCGRFYIAEAGVKGRRRYCSHEHQQQADTADAAERVRRYRERQRRHK